MCYRRTAVYWLLNLHMKNARINSRKNNLQFVTIPTTIPSHYGKAEKRRRHFFRKLF